MDCVPVIEKRRWKETMERDSDNYVWTMDEQMASTKTDSDSNNECRRTVMEMSTDEQTAMDNGKQSR